jgi:7-cyano-7-deazaguanine synthase
MDIVILFSGGMDSSLLLVDAQWSGKTVAPLFINYSQPHLKRERMAARAQVGKHLIERTVALSGGIVARTGSPVVPVRNAAMLAMGVNLAVELGASEVWIGACQADADVFSDCRQPFFDAFNEMLAAQGVGVRVAAPLISSSKREIRDRLGRLFSRTWSCYFPIDNQPCGDCGACKARVS